MPDLLPMCAPCSELPSNISTMHSCIINVDSIYYICNECWLAECLLFDMGNFRSCESVKPAHSQCRAYLPSESKVLAYLSSCRNLMKWLLTQAVRKNFCLNFQVCIMETPDQQVQSPVRMRIVQNVKRLIVAPVVSTTHVAFLNPRRSRYT